MSTPEKEKTDILISAIEERYNSIHKIRERVENIGIWSLGLLLTAGGWLIQSEVQLDFLQKTVAISGIVIAFVALRFVYLRDLCKGFKTQQRTVVRIEKALGFFESKFFDESNDSIYPTDWQKTGTEHNGGKFFNSTYILLYIGTIFLVISILINGVSFKCHYFVNEDQSVLYIN